MTMRQLHLQQSLVFDANAKMPVNVCARLHNKYGLLHRAHNVLPCCSWSRLESHSLRCLPAQLGDSGPSLNHNHQESKATQEGPPSADDPTLGEDEEEDTEEGRRAVDGFFDGKAYRLVAVEGGENTILINGVKMHISMGKLPFQDAEDKARLVKVRRGSTVLDVCCGLGYSAIACARLGARRVVSLELDPCVLEVARQNPASAALFDSGGVIDIWMGPAQDTVTTLPDEEFSAVLHDPPRFSHAGELYSQAFYNQIFRVLKCGGRFFHYTGSPNSRSSIPKGVKERLMRSGFVSVKWIDKCQGLLAMKP
ncbi:hypothetical protein PLESTB_001484900 [Pleodorina starrii]|uniref:Methyltransferase domain-containing protein n=1 Tax=Pleodorina starrii TaxID=330485 RepID=A0A9W6F7L0_9CHLO|nr:hypothetical protein PLESTM_000656700 [Pleodorina starrii]GLC59427.1 hypothetical protein PLESTB_001484900 [Pleodorina starrii]GLC74377.1 hypothetical protein PLESTF_001506600 [Pleodorina starrii]